MIQMTRRALAIGTVALAIAVSSGMWVWNVEGAAQDRPRDTSPGKDKTDSAIAETKTKGFDGVDFSYDIFGAPPGQDPHKTAEEAMAKDIADKPQVLARQKNC